MDYLKDLATRVDDVKKFGLYQFKQSFESFVAVDGVKNNTKFVLAVEAAKDRKASEKEQVKIDQAVASAVAKSKAEPRGLFGGMFV